MSVRDPNLPALFDPLGPNAPMIFAVLDGRVPGRALADDPDDPTMAIVQTSEGVAALSRQPSQAFLDQALAVLRADTMVGVIWQEAGNSVVPAEPDGQTNRVDFAQLDPASPALARIRESLPPGVAVRAITPDLLERCQWSEVITNAFGSRDAFFDSGLGVCLLLGEEVVAEAYAPYIGRGSAEIGVVTAEAMRGRGYACCAAAFLSASLAERNLTMYWSCDADNAPSIKVAEKLGFEEPRRFEMLLYRRLP